MDGTNENVASFGYDSVLARFEDFKLSNQRQRKLEQLKMGNEKVFFIIDGHSYVTAQNTQAASISSETDIVQVNDKPMPAEEVNRSIQRKNVTVVGSKKGILYLYVQTKTGDSTAP
jgi:calcineurin-like phosphoesterase family protein